MTMVQENNININIDCGEHVGGTLGCAVGESDGTIDGDDVGRELGYLVGEFECESDGTIDGDDVGRELGYLV
eukprot:CAMPEP_0198286322 /NCGR_PEP_ID=MMETSP1449-20131203/5439_1 /TAXON_ID=420275 /ORGANISM="Attheya septentrionalis, Strain CCMP2084" /LENGTH=71 /DNA_ID=CAMNT_0043984033 /DNA_START=554 /DNA_END=767 /DNA_ORIENTATION=+